MKDIDCILIALSEMTRYEEYATIPLERVELYKNLVQLRMVYFDKGFRPHLDLLNKILYGKYFYEASFSEKREMLSVWNLPGANALLAANPLYAAGYNVKVINNFDAELDLLENYAKRLNKPLIGISTTFILQWSEIGRIVKQIHKIIPNAEIILGGAFINDQYISHGVSIFEKTMRKYRIKYCVFSFNSELDFLTIIDAIYKKNGDVAGVNNLAFIAADGTYQITSEVWNDPKIGESVNVSALIDKAVPSKTVQIRTTSGCPFECSFCSYPSTAHGHYPSTVESVRVQLEALREMEGVEAVVFIDDTFNVPAKRFLEILKLLKQHRFRWYSFFRVQFADDELASLMKESGCDGVYAGLESANDIVLKNMNKMAQVKDYFNGIRSLNKAGIPVFSAFIVGYPGETDKSIKDTTEFINTSGLDFYGLKEFYYLHTAPIHASHTQFDLQGEGFSWKHGTMSSEEAPVMKKRIFDEACNSIHIDADMGLWYLIYLRDRGFSWDKIKEIQGLINEMIRQDNAENYLSKDELFNKLSRVVRSPRVLAETA